MRIGKRLFCILLALLMATGGLSLCATAVEANEVYAEEFYWDKAGDDADNGYKAYSVAFGDPLIVPEDPVREGSVFLGWKDWNTDAFVNLANETMNAKGRRFYAAWEQKTYPSTFYVFGEYFCTVNNVPGEPFIVPRSPEREGYTFSGWSPKLPATAPAEALTFNAVFTPNTYIATLIVDDAVYMEIEYTYGQKSIDLPAVPKKAGYSGAWEAYTLPIGGVTIHAIYTPLPTYPSTFYVFGEVFCTVNNIPGEPFIVPRSPEREGYTFSGWSPKLPATAPAEALTFNAVFTPNTYIATLIVDGAVYAEIEYTYGQKSIDLPAVPKKDGYTGAWEAYTLPIGGVTIHAIYTPNTYIATLIVDGAVYAEIEYTYGQKSIQLPDVPEKAGCTGAWEPYSLIVGGVTIHAVYTPITYIATLIVDGAVYKEIGYVYGQKSIDLPDVPKKAGYTGAWESYSLVIGGVTIHAIYTPNTYIASLIVDGAVYAEIEYTYGQKSIQLPDVPEKAGYIGRWESYTLPVDGVTIRAIYKPVDATAKTIAGDADGDGMISLRDATVMQRSLAGGWDLSEDTCPANMDVNGDGITNLKDVVLVRRYLAGGWNVRLV